MKLAVVTATTNLSRAEIVVSSWRLSREIELIVVVNGQPLESFIHLPLDWTSSRAILNEEYLGTVPAFRAGVDYALEHTDAEIICCLHDDLEMQDPDWIDKVIRHFERHEFCGLAGFGGAIGLGSDDIYQTPYSPMQLARIGFRSNLQDAEVHGIRSLLPEKVACLDGFSQIGRRQFWLGNVLSWVNPVPPFRPFTYLQDHGIIHHFYDGALGCLAQRGGWDAWYLPIRCRHLGGQTAVGDRGYQQWAEGQIPGGDQGFWEMSHSRGYELFRDVLPLRV